MTPTAASVLQAARRVLQDESADSMALQWARFIVAANARAFSRETTS